MMKKIHIKLISVVLTLILSVSVVAASSYAWLVLSNNPVATGVQVAIGGGNTVLIAPNIRKESVDGAVYNYPGHFSDKMNFGQQEAYAYLWQIGNLNPVSTVNGVDWILPAYYSGNDPEVQQGAIPSGAIKDISDFLVDSELAHANLSGEDEDKIEKGHYVYLDFWVVSPANDYKLRVSTGVDEMDGGSFVIDLMEPVAVDSGYELKPSGGNAASAVRVGFLANDLIMMDNTMQYYMESPYYNSQYSSLKGLYQEPNTGTAYLTANRFTIYEPNGDHHPEDEALDRTYVETKPLGLVGGEIQEQQTRSNLTVQKKSTWTTAAGSNATAVEQRFQTALYAGTWKGVSDTQEIADLFYGRYLQGQISPYVQKGGFVQRTDNLYTNLEIYNGEVPENVLNNENKGATDDVFIIELERNEPQRIRMFIWLEGQDMDCTESICSSRFAVNIELACGDE